MGRRIRTVRMSKGENMFCFPENIENQAKKLFVNLKEDNFWAGLSRRSSLKRQRTFFPNSMSFMPFAKATAAVSWPSSCS